MKRILSTGTALVVALLVLAGNLSARDEDKGGGNRSGGGRSGGDRGGSERSGSGQRNSGGSQNQFKKDGGEFKQSEGFKKLDQDSFRPKTNSGRQNNDPSKKFNKDDRDRDKDDNFRRDDDRDDKDRKHEDRGREDRDHAKHHDDNWKSWHKDGWDKDHWNEKYNAQHRYRHHGYWYGGRWIPPLIIVQRQPVVYLQPRQQIVVGQKWLGVTYEAYDGGGAYVTGIYRGSPAEQLGLEVGDVIVAIDGRDATDLPRAIQDSNGDITLQVLRGRTGELAEAQVNIIR